MNRGQARGSPRGGGGRFSANRGGQARGNPRDGRHFPLTGGHPPHRHNPQPGGGNRGPSANDYSGNKEFLSKGKMESPQSSFSKHSEHQPASSSAYRQGWRPSGRKDTLSNAERLKEGHNSTESVGEHSKELKCSVASVSVSGHGDIPSLSTLNHSGNLPNAERLKEGHNSTESVGEHSKELKCSVASVSVSGHGDIPSLSTLNHSGNLHMGVQRMQIGETPNEMGGDSKTSMPSKSKTEHGPFPITSPVNTTSHQKPELSEHSAVVPPFDLCPAKAGSLVTLKAPLLVQNRERRNEMKRSMEQQNGSVLQSGMVLLKSYLSISEQAKIVRLCQGLGLGPGGFYQPGYRDGAKLNLMMMCLGQNWDPETSKYGEHRPFDGAKPPNIPAQFLQLVENAIKESLSLIKKQSKASNSEDIFPWMSPDICIVNFYSSTGRLGLHQDRDESDQSLHKGLPVVSFSIGDSAEFLYGGHRDVDRADKVILESGDVLIFGGKSRHVFHGVASIKPNTAPKTLLEQTNLRAGRLNLTFREY